MAPSARKERRLKGLGVSPGIGIGTAYVRDSETATVRQHRLRAREVPAELDRFRAAVNRSRRQIMALKRKAEALPGSVEEELGLLLDASLQMLSGSRLVRGADHRIHHDRINAEAAVQHEIAAIAESFSQLDDAYIAGRLVDIREVGNRLVCNLTQRPQKTLSRLPRGSLMVTEELTPADAARLMPRRINGVATALGGAEGHAAIMMRALSIPAVTGAPDLLSSIRTGDEVIVDGETGAIVVNPTPTSLAHYRHLHEKRQRERRMLRRLHRLPAVTRDGIEVSLQANVELPIEMQQVRQSGAEGIGLLRTEFLFLNRDDMPSEDEQYAALKEIVEGMADQPATIRTLDIGGEKTTEALIGVAGPSISSPLGLRGVRLSLSRTDVLEAQFRAILRASALGPTRILLPMVTSAFEVRRARQILVRTHRALKRRGVAVSKKLPPLGVMIEVPAAALSADGLARVSDFFAVGSNDLTMYTLAADRSDDQVAQFFDILHPAVLRLMHFAASAANKADIPVSICGEMAGDPRYTALLVGLGFRNLSMASARIPLVKKRLRALNGAAAEQRVRLIMDQVDGGRIAALIEDFNALA